MEKDFEIIKAGETGNPDYREFLIANPGKVSSLPTTMPDSNGYFAGIGSMAYTDDLQHFYHLCTDEVWREVS